MLKRVAASAALVALVVAPANAEMRVAELGEVYESYNDCFAVTESGALAPDALVAKGWQRASMSDSKGKAIGDGPIIFGNPERAPIIMLSALEGDGVCVVIARIKNSKAFDQFKSAWGDQLPKPDKNGQITFFAEGRAVQMAPTGSKQKPRLRLVVGTRMESN